MAETELHFIIRFIRTSAQHSIYIITLLFEWYITAWIGSSTVKGVSRFKGSLKKWYLHIYSLFQDSTVDNYCNEIMARYYRYMTNIHWREEKVHVPKITLVNPKWSNKNMWLAILFIPWRVRGLSEVYSSAAHILTLGFHECSCCLEYYIYSQICHDYGQIIFY